MEHQDEILGSSGLHPLLIPDVIQAVMESSRLSVADLKICRLVCSDWVPPATAALSNKSKITIGGWSKTSQMMQFTETFSPGQLIPSKHFKLTTNSNLNGAVDIEYFMTDFKPLFDWPGLEIKSLILCNGSYRNVDVNLFFNHLSTLLKKTGYLEHLSFECWQFKFSETQNRNNQIIKNGSNIKSVALNNCKLSNHAANRIFMQVSFMKAFPCLESIDVSNPISYHSAFCTKIRPETLVSSVSWSKIKTLKIPELNSRFINQLNRPDMKLKHFHADVVCTISTSTAAWTSFWTKQNELESISINNINLMEMRYTVNSIIPMIVVKHLDYTFPLMDKLKRLQIGGNGILRLEERDRIFENCPKLNELIVGYLPDDMIFKNQQITFLTLENPDGWYWEDWEDLFDNLTEISKEYIGLKYLTINKAISDSCKKSVSNLFPDLLELTISPKDLTSLQVVLRQLG